MTIYTAFSILIVLSALFAYINHRFIKLPFTIGLMLIAMITSFGLIAVGYLSPSFLNYTKSLLSNFDFSEILLGSMLSFMLFAGAIHINFAELKKQRLPIILLSTFSVIISTFLVGIIFYYLTSLLGFQLSFISCLLFGSLISPTDPIAVLGILKEAKIAKSLEIKVAGESLFNDGVAVVVFLTILQVAENPASFHWQDVVILFVREAFGGIALGLLIGYFGFLLMKAIDNYKVEVLITLAIVMGGYSLADEIHVSGPLAMVAAGILIGNKGKRLAMSDTTAEYVDKFWELIDDILNAILFVLIGLNILIIPFQSGYILLGSLAILFVLGIRYISVLIPAQIIHFKEKIDHKTVLVLTWGGLRGGISIALALSLKPELGKDIWVASTYFIVAFSILIQGLTVGKLVKRL